MFIIHHMIIAFNEIFLEINFLLFFKYHKYKLINNN